MQNIAKLFVILACTALSLFLSACGKNASTDNAQLRFLHVSPDIGALNIQLNGESGNSFSALGFETISGYRTLSSGSREIRVNTASGTTPIDASYSLTATGKYTYIIAGSNGSTSALFLLEDTSTPASGYFRIRAANVAYPAGSIDIYALTGSNTIQTSNPILSGVSAGASTGFAELAQGAYRLVVTPYAVKQAIYDSGVQNFSSRVSVSLVAYTAGSSALVNAALVYPDETSSSFPANPYARIKAVQAITDVSSMDLLVDGVVRFSNIPYPNASSYQTISSGARNLKTEATTVPGSFLSNSTPTFLGGRDYSILNVGSNGVVQSIPLLDANYIPTSNKARVRFANANLAGVAINTIVDYSPAANGLGGNIAPNTASGYIELDGTTGTTHSITFTQAGNAAAVVLILPAQTFSAGSRYTVYLVGTAASPAYLVAQDI